MLEVLSFPLTPTPLSIETFLEAFFSKLFKEKRIWRRFSHFDLHRHHYRLVMLMDLCSKQNKKSKLMEELESRIFSEKPNHVDVIIIDAMFFLHLWKDLPATFGTIARFLLIKAFAQKGNNIHLVFDKVVSPSVKDCECDSRSGYQERGSQYQITGPNQRRTSNWLNALRFDQFKVAEIFEGKCLYVNDGDICYCFREENGQVTRTLIPELLSFHEEADSKMIYHLQSSRKTVRL